MYTLDKSSAPGRPRVIAQNALTPDEFITLAGELRMVPLRARKSGFVSAVQSTTRQPVITLWNGEETANTAEPGDYIAANLSPLMNVLRDDKGNPNRYVIRAAKFPDLYQLDQGHTEFGPIYRARGEVLALYLAGGFEIMAPWGEMQRAGDGYLLKNGTEIYGNAKETFEATYRRL